jgi:Na+/H+ antiporter NhaD/arsenite permease-like protein
MAALAIFIGTYFVLALGRAPGLRVDRAGAAVIGASLMVASGSIGFQEALAAVDWPTIVLLLGMMIVAANLRLAGFFRWTAAWVVRHAHHPRTLLAGVVAVSGVLSAIFVNDTICIVMTPLVVEVVLALRRNALPYLLAVAMASNAGSVATITGNPQNMMIGALSGISYARFAGALAPVAVISMAVIYVVLRWMFRKEFDGTRFDLHGHARVRVNRALLYKSLVVSVAMVWLFFAGWPVAQTAIVAGAVLLVTRRVKPEKVYREVDWPLLALFAGLFVVVAGVEKTSLEQDFLALAKGFRLDRVWALSGFSAALSNLVSNVPAVLVFKPVVQRLADPELGWLTLAMSSTLAGNLTILGSVANIIVVERARPQVNIRFVDYIRAGIPVTLLTLAAGVAWLTLAR